ncbi:MAG: hypothetical protein EXR36_11840 [Betaproteobacteria bacterium]|nr:hypothetical protein [Betaproteobacteria bacterium]
MSPPLPRERPRAVILCMALTLGPWQLGHAMAEDYGRNGGAQGSKVVRVGCKALADSAGREVSANSHNGSAVSRPAHCPDAKIAETEPAPMPKVAKRVTPDPLPDSIDVGGIPGGGSLGNLSLKVEPAGVALAITSGGALFWILRSGLWA